MLGILNQLGHLELHQPVNFCPVLPHAWPWLWPRFRRETGENAKGQRWFLTASKFQNLLSATAGASFSVEYPLHGAQVRSLRCRRTAAAALGAARMVRNREVRTRERGRHGSAAARWRSLACVCTVVLVVCRRARLAARERAEMHERVAIVGGFAGSFVCLPGGLLCKEQSTVAILI